jgi:hypothetical protein
MKQKLLSFLGSTWISDVDFITDSNVTIHPAVDVYPTGNFFTQGLLTTLIKFADNNGYLYYIDVFDGDVRIRIFEDVES